MKLRKITNNKKFGFVLLLIIPIFVSHIVNASASENNGAGNNAITVILNNTQTNIAAFYDGDICYIAARPVLEYLGTVVFWNKEQQTIALNSRDGVLGIHKIGDYHISVNGDIVHAVAPSVMTDGTTYMPLDMLLSFIGDNDVFENREQKIISINKYFFISEYHIRIQKILSQIAELEYYNPLNFIDYLKYQSENPQFAEDKVILYVNIGVTKQPYSDIKIIENPHDTFVVLDKNHKFADDYEPELSKIDGLWWKQEAGEAWLVMKDAACADGVYLTINNTYRCIAEQRIHYNSKISSGRSVANVDEFNSRPGHSEHHTGWAADINPIGAASSNSCYTWIAANSYKYGFIVSFQSGKEFINHYSPEPWHIRWFPQWAAVIMYEQNLTIQEFDNIYLNPKKHGFEANLSDAKDIAERDYLNE